MNLLDSELSLFGERLSISSWCQSSRAHTAAAAQRFSLPKASKSKVVKSSKASLASSLSSAQTIIVKSPTISKSKAITAKPVDKDIPLKKTNVEKKSKLKDDLTEADLHERLRRRAQLIMINQLLRKLEDAKLIENKSV
jgi:hypothetical protein